MMHMVQHMRTLHQMALTWTTVMVNNSDIFNFSNTSGLLIILGDWVSRTINNVFSLIVLKASLVVAKYSYISGSTEVKILLIFSTVWSTLVSSNTIFSFFWMMWSNHLKHCNHRSKSISASVLIWPIIKTLLALSTNSFRVWALTLELTFEWVAEASCLAPNYLIFWFCILITTWSPQRLSASSTAFWA